MGLSMFNQCLWHNLPFRWSCQAHEFIIAKDHATNYAALYASIVKIYINSYDRCWGLVLVYYACPCSFCLMIASTDSAAQNNGWICHRNQLGGGTTKQCTAEACTYFMWHAVFGPGPLLTKRTDSLLQNPLNLEAARLGFILFSIALKFDRHIGNSAAEMPVQFQSDTMIMTSNRATLRLHEIWR